MSSPVTIRQVASAAGVAVSTVSRALNGGVVRDATRERVTAVADRLGYVPNATARGLVRSRTDAIGVVLPFLTGEFYPEVVRGLDLAVQAEGQHLLLTSSHNSPADTVAVLRSMHGRVDGLVLMTPAVSPARVAEALPPSLPTVLLNAWTEGHDFNVLSTDSYGGARLAVEHLADLGHRRIAVLTGERGNHDADTRLRGWSDALADRGIGVPDAFVLRGDFSRESGSDAGERLAELVCQPDGPTAAFVASDYMAVGAIRTLLDAGLSVPGDLAVASFDDVPSSAYIDPPLTTVQAGSVELGAQAAAWLQTPRAAGPRREVLPARLIVRATSGDPL